MERLTYNFKVGDMDCWTVEGADNLTCDEICKRQEDDGCRTCPIEKMYNRLGEIEDILGDDYDLDRLNELAKADKEERCVILPVKVGDIVYQITKNFISEFKVFYIEISTCENIFIHTHLVKGINMTGEVFPSTRIGENLFLTRKEAERALKERENK